MVDLHDDVVRLTPPVESDIPAIVAACQDPAVAAWTTVPSPYTRDDAEQFVTGYVVDGWNAWADGADDGKATWAIRTATGLAGMVGLTAEPVRSAEVGYWMAPAARGRGLLHRSLDLVLDWAFDAADGPHLDRVVWHALAGNWASWRAAWRVGFQFEGVQRLGSVQHGSRRDTWTASLLRDDPRTPVGPWPATTIEAPTP
ncbi:MAG: GNAT family N-acetyltransferase [Cellulomonas sp.]|jgi:RimJ/RimL family protein N-acetyltransferase|nr:GNAT family N-acetyltransferase [Cellulomonas sp.]